jgi:hypothetical protein
LTLRTNNRDVKGGGEPLVKMWFLLGFASSLAT